MYYKKATKFGSQNFGYQIWFCTRLIMYLSFIIEAWAGCWHCPNDLINISLKFIIMGTIVFSQNWCQVWLGTEQVASHYLTTIGKYLRCHRVPLGCNELNHADQSHSKFGTPGMHKIWPYVAILDRNPFHGAVRHPTKSQADIRKS